MSLRRRVAAWGEGLLWAPALAFLAVFYVYPLATMLRLSFARGDGGPAAAFLALAASSTARNALVFTFAQAAASTALTFLVGLPGAYLFARFRFRGKTLLRALTGVPFVLPTLVVAAAFNALLGPRGVVNGWLMAAFDLSAPPIAFLNTLGAILVAHVFYNTTIVLRLVGDFWAQLDPSLADAARMLGASRAQVARQVTLPLLGPALAAAGLLVFLFNFTSFGVILILGGPQFATMEVEIYYQTVGLFNLPLAAALAVLQLACTLTLTVVYTRLSSRVARPLKKTPAARPRPLTTTRQRVIAGVLVVGLLALLTAPLGALAMRSVTPMAALRGEAGGPTLAFYQALRENPRQSAFFAAPATAIALSLTYALATMVLGLAIGAPAAWALARSPGSRIGRILDPAFMLPLGTSAVTLGLGFIVALGRPPLDLRASPLLIPLAHTLVAFPFVVRSLVPALRSIQPQLRQAAAVLGASPRQVVRHVDAPLVGRALIVGATFAFMISLGEFGATSVIARPEYPTVPVAIYRFLSRPGELNYGQAMALSTILMVMTAAGMMAIERFRIARVGEF